MRANTVKSQIMLMEPLPTINKVLSLVVQHERQLGRGAVQSTESSAFFVKGNFASNNNSYNGSVGQKKFGSFSNTNKRSICSYSGLQGHTVDRCYKKHGFTPRYKPKNKNIASSLVNQVEGDLSCISISDNPISNNLGEPDAARKKPISEFQGNGNMQSMMSFTQEQYQPLLSLIQPKQCTGQLTFSFICISPS